MGAARDVLITFISYVPICADLLLCPIAHMQICAKRKN